MLRNSLQGSMFLGVEGLKHMNMWYRIKCQLKGSNKRQSNFISKKDGWVTSERIYRVGNGIFNTFLPNKYKLIFGQISFAKIIDTSNFLMFFPTLKENKMSEPLKEETNRTWRVGEREKEEKANTELHKCLLSMLQIKAENRKEKSNTQPSQIFPLSLEKIF